MARKWVVVMSTENTSDSQKEAYNTASAAQLVENREYVLFHRDNKVCQICGNEATETHHLLKSKSDSLDPNTWDYVTLGWTLLPEDSHIMNLRKEADEKGRDWEGYLREMIENRRHGLDAIPNLIAICKGCHVGQWGIHSEERRKGTHHEILSLVDEMPVSVVRAEDLPDKVARPEKKLDQLAKIGDFDKFKRNGIKVYAFWKDDALPTHREPLGDLIDVENGELHVCGWKIREGNLLGPTVN